MSNLDVALTLRLINQLSGGAKTAVADLKSIVAQAKALDGTHSTKLAADLNRDAAAATKTGAALRQAAADAGRLSASGRATATFGQELGAAAAAGTKLDGALKAVASDRAGLAGLSAVAKALAADMDKAATATMRAGRAKAAIGGAGGGSAGAGRGGHGAGAGGAGGGGHGGGFVARNVASLVHAAGPLGLALTAGEIAHHVVRAQAKGEHEVVRMRSAGMNPGEVEDALKEARALSSANVAISRNDILHQLRNARAIVGSAAEAAEVMDPLLKLRTVAMGARPGANMEEDFDKLIKGLEIKGVTQNLPEFKSYLDGMAKAINTFGDTLKPTDYYEMFKYGHQSTQSLSKDFMLSVAPTIAQELGGSSAGVGFSDVFQALVGGHMQRRAARKMDELGLINPDGAERKKGKVDHIKPGGIVRTDLAASNPYEWVQTVLLPAFQKHGIETKEAVAAAISTLFPNQVAAQLVSLFATQQSRIEKDRALVRGSEGLEAAKRYETTSPLVAWESLKAQAEGLATSLNLISNFASGLNGVANRLGEIGSEVESWKRRLQVRDAGRDPDAGAGDGFTDDPTAWAARHAIEAQRAIYKWGMDTLVAPLPTDDPQRGASRHLLHQAGEAGELSEKLRHDAEALDARSKAAKTKAERDDLSGKADALRTRADASEGDHRVKTRIGGKLAAADMTDVEIGEAAAQAAIRAIRARREQEQIRTAPPLPGPVPISEQGGPASPFVFDPATGLFRRREAASPKPSALPRPDGGSFGLGGAPLVAGAGAGVQTFGDRGPGVWDVGGARAAFAPMRLMESELGTITQSIQAAAKIDLTGTAAETASGYTSALTSGLTAAEGAVSAAVARMKAELSFTATPTIAPRIQAPSGGASPASAPGAPGLGGGTRSAGVSIGTVHVHGTTDLAGIHQETIRVADRYARDGRDDALHDLGGYV